MEIYKPEFIHVPDFENVLFRNGVVKECIKVPLTLLDRCVSDEASFWCAKDKGNSNYAKGIISNAVGVGIRGEIAFAKIFNLSVSIGYVKYGEKKDFDISAVFKTFRNVDIKTGRIQRDVNYIRVINERGNKIPLKSDLYIGAFLNDIKKCVYLTGWNTRNELITHPTKEAPCNSSHKNIEMCVSESRHMLDLFHLIK